MENVRSLSPPLVNRFIPEAFFVGLPVCYQDEGEHVFLKLHFPELHHNSSNFEEAATKGRI
ncbi:uncharacterized protein RAG0_15972 [Rhynchosporium agropyri]|uniref:Uncharacterized protein n=2 Tax=Rhynchosporium TaxID=38037 RepID=A0A1E1MT71_RHYSE|nr:uncharacterized protein RAG0_15972 [Rhynchosporium agropyri]CZT52259.1 uncharacterized protein RSE6_13550 [Rhynchosporium secalis]